MKLKIVFVATTVILLASCAGTHNQELLSDQSTTKKVSEPMAAAATAAEKTSSPETDHPAGTSYTDKSITSDAKGNLLFNLTDTASICIRSASVSEGVTITDTENVKDIYSTLSKCTPCTLENYANLPYEYSLTFLDASGTELAVIKAYDNFILSYDGKYYYDETEQFYIWKIRQPYIEEVKKTFSCDITSFTINGKVYDMKELDPYINAITEFSWLGNEELPEPALVLECHINPNVGYCAVFDVEKMDYVFHTYGTNFTTGNSFYSIVYEFQNNVYNYWGDLLYHNPDDKTFISNLEYEDTESVVAITLSYKDEEKSTTLSRINYHKIRNVSITDDLGSKANPKYLAEFKADLTHDGKTETLSVLKYEDGDELALLTISDISKTILWTEEAHTSHAGWNSIYLCHLDGEDYLLAFNPYQSTGIADFTYVLFHITGQKMIEVSDSGYYSFSYSAQKGDKNAFNEETFRTFADKVNSYLQNSYLLLSTENGDLRYSTKDHLIKTDTYNTEQWLSEIQSSLIF